MMKAISTEIIKQYEHIVFGIEHYNPLGIVRSLGENGIRPIGIIIMSQQPITSKSKYFKEVIFVSSIEDGYKLLLDRWGQKKRKSFIYTSDDQITNYIDMKYDEIKDKFYFFNAGKVGGISYYMDKYNICNLAKNNGLRIAQTVEVEKGYIPPDLQYPIITKAIKSTIDNWKADSFICRNENELREAYKKIRSKKVLLQEYIEKKNELCLDGCVCNKGKDVYISIASTYNYILPDTYSPLMTVKSFDHAGLKRKIGKMFEQIGFEGIFSMEFLVGANKELYFLEINFRNSTWSYASTIAGMPLPIIWANGTLGIEQHDCIKKIQHPFVAMVEFEDYRNRVKHGNISSLRWFVEFLQCRCKYCFSLRDIKPFASVVLMKVKKRIR